MPFRTAALLAMAAAVAPAITLVENGKSSYTISLPAGAIPSEQRAAAELQRFLEEMSGARLPIEAAPSKGRRIVIRNGPLGAEEYTLRVVGRDLVITGGRPRGALYGVYALLDRLGCRWYTREVSRIPRLPTLRLDRLDERGKPFFEYREPFMTEAWDRDWAARNRVNGNRHDLDLSTGGKVVYYPFVHSFYEILPPDKHFQDHPEYYSLIDGKRRWERGQLCLTNPEVLRLTVERVRGWIRERPEATIFSVSQNDWEGWCECDSCRRVEQEEGGEHSGPVLRFVNAVAEEIGKTSPDKLIDTLAYWYTENPPARVRPRPNVRIRLCPIGVCESHPYEKCPRSAYFVKNLRAWSRITNQLYIWHYNTNFSHYLLPFPDFDQVATTVPLYARSGVVGIFFQGAYPPNGGGEASELHAWVMARLLWDPTTDVNRAVDEFLGAVYGGAAPAMRAWFDLQHSEARAGRHLWIFNVPDFSPDFSSRAAALLQKAEQTAGDDAIRARVRKARLSIDYYDLLRAKTYNVSGGTYAPESMDGLQDRWRSLVASLRGFGITHIREHSDLLADEKSYAGLKPHRLLTLENDGWRADIALTLGGRVIRLIEKRSGRDLLRRLSPGEGGYPAVAGAIVGIHADYQARGWRLEWNSGSEPAADEVLLGATAENGLKLTRRLRLTASGLLEDLQAENPGAEPVAAVLRHSIDLDPGDIDRASVRFRRAGQTEMSRDLILPEEPPTGAETWSGVDLPEGLWSLTNGRATLAEGRFDPSLAGRAQLTWTAKSPARATLTLWSKPAMLRQGEILRLTTEYGR